MRTLSTRGNRFRAFALLGGAALALHQLRYVLAHGGHSDHQLSLGSHAYLSLALAFVVAVVLLAAAAFVVKLVEAYRTPTTPVPDLPGQRSLWIRSSVVLLAVYGLQEWLEGAIANGHAGGLDAVFARGGWWAIPLALVLGALVACLLRGATTAIVLVAGQAMSRRREAGSAPATREERPAQKPSLDVVASFLAGRGPPVASV